MTGSARVTETATQLLDLSDSNQLPQRPPTRLTEQRPRIDDPVILKHSGPRPISSIKRHQPHAPQPRELSWGGRVPPHQTLNLEP